MNIIEILAPVLVMMLIGMVCRKCRWIRPEGIEDIKFIITKIILPVAIFHALGTAEYNTSTAWMVFIMLVMILATFAIGFPLRKFVQPPFGKYVPYMVSIYEGGMIAYPLFANLCGSENLSKIAMLDIAGLLFGFSIYMGLLQQTEHDEPADIKFLILDAIKNPAFIASVLGVIVGVTGVLRGFIGGMFGQTYLNVQSLITAPLTAMILLVVGYGIETDSRYLRPSLITIGLRAAVQGVFMIPVVLLARMLFDGDTVVVVAIISYMSAPATFSMQSFLKTEEGSAYASTTNSLYCFVSVAVYAVMAWFVAG